MAFGLQNFVIFDSAKLADNAVSRHHQHVGIGVERANIVTQWANEEVVKGAVSGGIRLLRLFHIDLVVFDEQIDNQFSQPACSFTCPPACEAGEPQFRQNVL